MGGGIAGRRAAPGARLLSTPVDLALPPEGLTWELQCALEAIGEKVAEEKAGAGPGLLAAPATRLRVLVVEDEAPIARDIARILQNAGFEALGPAGGRTRALELVSTVGCDAAVLDIRLGTRTSEAVALALRERGIPFIAVSAYSRTEMPAAFGDTPLVDKPLQAELLVAHLRRCIESQRSKRPGGDCVNKALISLAPRLG